MLQKILIKELRSSLQNGKRKLVAGLQFNWRRRSQSDASKTRVVESKDFMNTRMIYKDRPNQELIRSLIVFHMCSSDFLVNKQAMLLKLTRSLFGKKMFESLMEATIFGQFMVLEDEDKILKHLQKQINHGILPMLTYTAAEFHGASLENSPKKEMNEWIDKNFLNVLKSLNIASKCHDFSAFEPVVPTKITFLTNFSVLKMFNDIIKEQQNFIARGGPEVNQWLPEKTAEKDLSCALFSANFHLDFNKFLSKTPDNGKNLRLLNEIEIRELEALINRLEKLSQVALESNITLNFDAEQTYLQTAIDTLVLDVQRKFNKNKPVVLNTYQCYLKTAGEAIERHLQIASKERFCFGGKIVRGAYMNEERNLAKEERRADPINDNYEATTRMYERATELLLNEIKQKPEFPLRLIFATHNQGSIIDILTRMEEKGIEATKHGISFAQLIGMRDYITYTLGSKGIPVSKLVHYSNPTDGLAYLSRRLHENRIGLQNLEIEKKLPWVELKRRMFHPFKRTTPEFD